MRLVRVCGSETSEGVLVRPVRGWYQWMCMLALELCSFFGHYSGGSRILKRGVRIIRCTKSGKNFCLTIPTFSETMPIKSPVYLVRVPSHKK